MSLQIQFHCVWVPADRVFRLSVGTPLHQIRPGLQRSTKPNFWDLTPGEFESVLAHARSQLVDTTDAVVQYQLKFPQGGITFNKGRQAFEAIVVYLQKVYDSWANYQQ